MKSELIQNKTWSSSLQKCPYGKQTICSYSIFYLIRTSPTILSIYVCICTSIWSCCCCWEYATWNKDEVDSIKSRKYFCYTNEKTLIRDPFSTFYIPTSSLSTNVTFLIGDVTTAVSFLATLISLIRLICDILYKYYLSQQKYVNLALNSTTDYYTVSNW